MGKLKRVTKLQAKKLKQLGYNRDVTAYYLENKARLLNKMLFETHVSEDWNHNKNGSQYRKETDPLYPFISAPTLDEVIEWLREKHNIIITIELIQLIKNNNYDYCLYFPNKSIDYCSYFPNKSINYCSYFLNKSIDCGNKDRYSKIEHAKREAISKAIKYILKNDKVNLHSRVRRKR